MLVFVNTSTFLNKHNQLQLFLTFLSRVHVHVNIACSFIVLYIVFLFVCNCLSYFVLV